VILLKSIVQIATCPMPHMAAKLGPDCPGIGIVAVRGILEAGTCAPSGGNMQRWRLPGNPKSEGQGDGWGIVQAGLG
jgi:hypothetical protein